MLRVWKELTDSHSQIWEGDLLDQAWSLVASQFPLRTVWLPRSYHASIDDGAFRSDALVVHNIPEGTGGLNPQGSSLPISAARRAGRAGTPGPHLVLTSSKPGHQTAVVMVNNISSCDAHRVALTVECIANAFINNPGCFSLLELSVCNWQQDLNGGFKAAQGDGAWAVTIDPAMEVPVSLFRDIAHLVSTNASSDRVIRLPRPHPRITQHPFRHNRVVGPELKTSRKPDYDLA
jgi:hypothetical protein